MRAKASLLAQKRLCSVTRLTFMLFLVQSVNAELYQWKISIPGESTAFLPFYAAACQYYSSNISKNWLKTIEKMNPKWVQCNVSGTGGIIWQTSGVTLIGNSCPLEAELNNETGSYNCRPGYEMDDAGYKLPDEDGLDKGAPPSEGCAGNLVNITDGNKYQVEHDLITSILFARHYNGLDGLWRHSFSPRIIRKDDNYLLYREDGKVSEFTRAGRDLTSFTDLGRLGRLVGRFFYTSELNEIIEFDPYGKLARLKTKEGRKYRVERGANLVTSDEHGNKLVLSEGANHQLLRVQTGGISIEYTYDKEQRLTSVARTDGQHSTKTQHLYDDPRNVKLFTGV